MTFADGSVATAKVIGTDPYSDLAVIQVDVDASRLHPLTLGDSDVVRVGQRVIAIGNPFGLFGTMTVGIISGKGRTGKPIPSSAAAHYIPTPISFRPMRPSILAIQAARCSTPTVKSSR